MWCLLLMSSCMGFQVCVHLGARDGRGNRGTMLQSRLSPCAYALVRQLCAGSLGGTGAPTEQHLSPGRLRAIVCLVWNGL